MTTALYFSLAIPVILLHGSVESSKVSLSQRLYKNGHLNLETDLFAHRKSNKNGNLEPNRELAISFFFKVAQVVNRRHSVFAFLGGSKSYAVNSDS